MTFKIATKPRVMGGAMGLMMLWMIHQQMTTPTALQGTALAAFISIHLLLLGALIGGAIFATRLHPRLQRIIAKLHRRSWAHMRDMVLGMAVTAGLAHLILHGGI